MLNKKVKQIKYKKIEKENLIHQKMYCLNFKPKRTKKTKMTHNQIINNILKDQINGWEYHQSPTF